MSAPGTLERVLEEARAELGTEESPRGSNRQEFSKAMGRPPEPWCADFVAVIFRRAGVPLPSESAYTPTMAAGFQKAGRWSSRPQVGAVVFFRWPLLGRIAHVGIVEQVRSDGSVVCIEGNTDAAGGRTGGRVMRQVRRANIAGYGLPVYSPAPPPASTTAEDDDMENCPQLSLGSDAQHPGAVRRLRGLLMAAGHRLSSGVEGGFGAGLASEVRAFQKNTGLEVDGVVGQETWRLLRRGVGPSA